MTVFFPEEENAENFRCIAHAFAWRVGPRPGPGHHAKDFRGARQRAGWESVAECARKGYKVVAVVVDLDGVRQAVLRGDGAPIHSMDNAYYKAYTIASLGLSRKEESTKAIVDRMAKAPPTTVPQTPLPNVTYAVGAIAIMANGNTIGGLGVSGAPGGQFDEECARAAMAKVKDRMK